MKNNNLSKFSAIRVFKGRDGFWKLYGTRFGSAHWAVIFTSNSKSCAVKRARELAIGNPDAVLIDSNGHLLKKVA